MTAQPKTFISEELYLTHERESITKHEYYAGEVYAMAGASEQHNLIAMNIAASLHSQLRGGECRTYPSDMRVKVVKTGLHTYPDFTVVCGQSLFTERNKRDTLINPTIIIEILSPSTERYDRGMKFQHYRTIETLQEYVLVSQDKYHIERFIRQEPNEWLFSEVLDRDSSLALPSIQGVLALRAVYEGVIFIPEVVSRITRDIPSDEDGK